MENKTQGQFDYFAVGKFQIIIALLAYMQGGYWLKIGHPSAVEAGRLSPQLITAMDWTCIAMMILAVLPLCRGIYLIRKSRSLGHG